MKKQQLPGLGMGIGINAGQVIVGNIGSDTRAKLNITSRIQAEAEKQEIVVSESVFQYTKDQIQIKKIFSAELKGVDGAVTLRTIEPIIAYAFGPFSRALKILSNQSIVNSQ